MLKTKEFNLGILSLSFMAIGIILFLKFYKVNTFKILANIEDRASQSLKTAFDGEFEQTIKVYDEIKAGENLSSALERLYVSKEDKEILIRSLDRVINLKNLKIGTGIMLERVEGNVYWSDIGEVQNKKSLIAIEIFLKESNYLSESIYAFMEEVNGQRTVTIRKNKPNIVKNYNVLTGTVKDNLYQSMIRDGADPQLVNNFADIFAWQIDFYRETRQGDKYQLLVEENIVDGRKAGFGTILAAEYSLGNKSLRGYYFVSHDKTISGYFDEAGKSLKNAFLKAPIKLGYLTSRFGMRFHPVQKRLKAHNGVDYGAAKGTPIMAVASGIVVNAGFNPFNGNWARIRHKNGYETEYLHATHLAKGVRVGAAVRQGQVIAYVGRTGLATGYHLHFGMKKNGRYVDPVKQKFARAEGIEKRYLSDFKQKLMPLSLALTEQKIDREKMMAKD